MFKVFLILSVLFSLNVSALELQAYKSTSSSVTKIADGEVEKVFASSTPACLKDGSKILGVNKAFTAKNLGYRDCSSSDAAKEKQKLLGYEVAVIKLTELSASKAKEVMGISTKTKAN